MTVAVRHAGIVVKDLAKSLAFWCDWLGLSRGSPHNEGGEFIDTIFGGDEVRVTTHKLFGRGGVAVELLEVLYPTPSPAAYRTGGSLTTLTTVGLTHVAVTVDSLASLGVHGSVNPEGTARVAFVKDPNGVMVELVEEIGQSRPDGAKTSRLEGAGSPEMLPDYLAHTYDPARVPFTGYPLQLAWWLNRKVIVPRLKRRYDNWKLTDLGCGRGEYLDAFGLLGYEAQGVDLSLEGRKYTRRPIVRGDVERYNDVDRDVVFSKSVIEHCRDPLGHLQSMRESLAPGGVVVVLTPSWRHHGWGSFYIDHTHVSPFTAPSLTTAMELAGFTKVTVRHFVQLPVVWDWPILHVLVWLTRLLPLPYRPWNARAPWPEWLNKWIRFSKEVMLLGVGEA